jgi:hypothetical protein
MIQDKIDINKVVDYWIASSDKDYETIKNALKNILSIGFQISKYCENG